MCGICGELTFFNNRTSRERIQPLIALMHRRGPDDEGIWTDGEQCTLGFRRLAILDLTPMGHQPMVSVDKRYVIAYNGEIYNFPELREQLSKKTAIPWRSTGDTEVVLNCLTYWGTAALALFNGMFALALYDTLTKSLLLARDYAGIKPLYYMETSQGLVFASQYDQILAHPWSRQFSISADALALYLRLGYIPAPYGILEHTYMLEPGAWLEVTADGKVRKGFFYEFPQYIEPDLSGPEAYEAVDAALNAAIKRHMISDVPVGTFLSGGIDSPLVTAKAQAISHHPLKAFTIGTNGDRFDESTEAIVYGQELGVDHIVEHIKPEQSLSFLDDVVAACGEPFADYSIFPTLMVSRLASRYVKVVLSGDGGDELFWGYAGRFASVIARAPDFRLSHWLRSWQWGMKKFFGLGTGYYNLRYPTIGDWYRVKHTRLPEAWLQNIFPDLPAWPSEFPLFVYNGWDTDKTAQWLRWNEFVGHLTMVLLKVDRASMFHSLEVRVPFLDKEVLQLATRIDWRSCLDLFQAYGKIPLRYSLQKYVKFQTRTKKGFSVPMDNWLRGPLKKVFLNAFYNKREILGLTLNSIKLHEFFYLHANSNIDYSWGLWVLLSLALWEQRYRCRC